MRVSKLVLLLSMLALSVAFTYVEANAAIVVDPGPAGSAEYYRLEFEELLDQPLDGSTIDLTFAFKNGTFIEWLPGEEQGSRTVCIDYYADAIGDPIFNMYASGGVTDISGNLIGEQPPTISSSFFFGDIDVDDAKGFGGASVRFPTGTTPLRFYGAKMTMTLPDVPGAYIYWSAVTFSQSGEGLYTVSTVPIPPTLLLFGSGLLLLLGKWRNNIS